MKYNNLVEQYKINNIQFWKEYYETKKNVLSSKDKLEPSQRIRNSFTAKKKLDVSLLSVTFK